MVYLLKLVSPRFDRYTNYGKLKADRALGDGLCERGTAFVMFYAIGLISVLVSSLVHCVYEDLEENIIDVFSDSRLQHNALLAIGRVAHVNDVVVPSMFALHCFVRLFECLFVHRFSQKEKVNALSLVSGAGFYGFAGVTVSFTEGGGMGGREAAWLLLVFLVFKMVQVAHHLVLASVRMDELCLMQRFLQKSVVQKSGRVYALPKELLFRWLACPHYTAEIAMYAVMFAAHPSKGTSLMFLFVLISLGVSSYRTARWYKGKFGAELYALVPNVI